MAKLTAPVLSFAGSGKIAKTLVFGTWRGVKYARQYVVPANPQTTAQTQVRDIFAMMREMWKLAPDELRAPWDRMAQGRQFLGLNKFIGENLRVLNGETDMDNFIASPGAAGGLPMDAFGAATGSGSGEIDLTFTSPTPPSGWTLDAEIGVAFPDQDPTADFGGPLVVDENDPATGSMTLTGLGSAVACQAAGFIRWVKPDGSLVYSVGVTDQATSGA